MQGRAIVTNAAGSFPVCFICFWSSNNSWMVKLFWTSRSAQEQKFWYWAPREVHPCMKSVLKVPLWVLKGSDGTVGVGELLLDGATGILGEDWVAWDGYVGFCFTQFFQSCAKAAGEEMESVRAVNSKRRIFYHSEILNTRMPLQYLMWLFPRWITQHSTPASGLV